MKPQLHAIALALSLTLAVAPAFAQDTASISQSGSNDVASISQVGNQGANDASIVQGASVERSSASINQSNVDNASASIRQGPVESGVALNAAVDQRDSRSVTARISQDGLFHQASVLQAGSGHSEVSISQLGNIRGEGNATVTVLDSENTSVVIATAGIAEAVINQSNVFNGSIELDTASILTSARINQHDASNVTARVGQTGLAEANIEQTGDGGAVITEQAGDVHLLNVVQDGGIGGAGPGSLVSITQDGAGHTATVTQVGRGFTATILQAGSGNTTTINQHY